MKAEGIYKKEVLNPKPSFIEKIQTPKWVDKAEIFKSKDHIILEVHIPKIIIDCYQVNLDNTNLKISAGIHYAKLDFRIEELTISLENFSVSRIYHHKIDKNIIKIFLK